MELMLKLTDIAFTMAVAFLAVAALITAIRCNAKRGNAVPAWILFLGCLIGFGVSLGHLVFAFMPGGVLYGSGVELSYAILVVLALINVVSKLAMVVGAALFNPRAAIPASPGGER